MPSSGENNVHGLGEHKQKRDQPNRALGLVLLAALVSAAGCVAPRADYYEALRLRQASAYHRWQMQQEEDAQRPRAAGPLSLEEAVRLGLECSPKLQATLQARELARGRLVEAYSEALPSVDLSAGYTRLDQTPTVNLGTTSFAAGDRDNYSYRVEITQPIYKGGAAAIALRAARIYSYLSDETVRGAAEDVIYAIAQAYHDTVLARHLVGVQEDGLRSAQAHLQDVESRRQHGVATEYDVLRARVDVSNIQAALIEQTNRRDLACTRLFRAMGVSQRSTVDLVTDLGYDPADPDPDEAVRTALQNRPDLYQALLNVDLQREALDEARSHYLPRVNAYFWHLWAKPDPHESSNIEWDRQWQAGLGLTWPLFDGLAREGRIIQETARLRQQEINLSDAEEQALLEVTNALLEMENARKLVESQQLNLERADRALALVEAGYREGVNTELEVLDGRVALTDTRGLYYTALHRYTSARLALQKSMGILGAPPGARDVPEQGSLTGRTQPPTGTEGETDAERLLVRKDT